MTAKFVGQCPSRVILDGAGLGGKSPHVRFAPKVIDALRCRELTQSAISGCERSHQKPALYSITSSAATSRPGGTVRPSTFDVLRLTVVSYLVGACTGSSPGFAPRRMRST